MVTLFKWVELPVNTVSRNPYTRIITLKHTFPGTNSLTDALSHQYCHTFRGSQFHPITALIPQGVQMQIPPNPHLTSP